jgi:hypothetical protein
MGVTWRARKVQEIHGKARVSRCCHLRHFPIRITGYATNFAIYAKTQKGGRTSLSEHGCEGSGDSQCKLIVQRGQSHPEYALDDLLREAGIEDGMGYSVQSECVTCLEKFK